MEVHTIQKGDTRSKLARILMQGDQPVDLTGQTVKVYGETDAGGTDWIALTATGVTAHPTNTFTTNTLDGFDRILHDGTLAKNGMQVKFSSTTTLPTNLVAGTWYYVQEADLNGFKVSRTPNGQPIDITDAGTGTHSYIIKGSIQYEWQTADVDTAGIYWLWFIVGTTAVDTFPTTRESKNRGQKIEIVEAS